MNQFMRSPQFPVPPQTDEAKEISEYLRRLHSELTEYMQLLATDIRKAITTTDLDDLANTELADPNADRIVFWDDGAGYYTWLRANTGLAISGTDLNLSHLGLESLADPNADRIFFWDDSEGASKWLAPDGTTIEISGTTLQVIGAGVEIPDQNVLLDEVGSATYDDLNDYLNNTQSAGKISGGTLSDSGGGEIDVAAGTGIIKTSNSAIGPNTQFDWPAFSNVSLTDNSMNYLYIYITGGSPAVGVTTTRSDIHFTDQIGLGRVYRSGTSLSILTGGVQLQDSTYRTHKRFAQVDGFIRGSGAVTTMALLKVAVTEGVFYYGITSLASTSLDTGVAGTFISVYSDGGAGWTEVAAQTDIDKLNWDDGTGALNTVSVTRYGVHWLYWSAGNEAYYVMYGTGDYKLSEAQEAKALTSLPPHLTHMGFLIAKIIVAQNGATAYQIDAPWDVVLTGSGISDHGDLAGLSDDDHVQYLILTGVRAMTGNLDMGNQNIVNPGTGHDAFTDFVANEHIDHTAVTLTAGEGLTGGGDISANRTFDLDVNSLVEKNPSVSGDYYLLYDSVAGDHKKVDHDNMPGGINYWTQAATDIYYDDGGSATVGTTAKSSKMTEGITIYQGASNDEIFALQASVVNHGITTWADTDTYFNITKNDAARGGIFMSAFTNSGATRCVNFGGWSPSVTTTKTTAGAHSIVELFGIKTSGVTFTNIDATANLVSIYTYIGGGWYNRWWVDANGDTYQAGDFYCGDQAASQTPQQTIRRRDDNNIWIGMSGGAAWTTGDRNYSLGDYALDAITEGFDNICLGYNAGTALTTGDGNVAIGHDALEAGQDVGNCVAIGYESLESHNSGNGVIALGYHSAWNDASVPQFNIYIGHNAGGTSVTLGANQIAIGWNVLQNCSGAENVAIGYNACPAAMSGASNTVIGSQSGTLMAAGAQNTVVGADAGDNISSGSDNVAIGYKAGDGTSSGGRNVWIGSLADGNAVAARVNSIAIGYDVSVDADNKIVIGNSNHTAMSLYGDITLVNGTVIYSKASSDLKLDCDARLILRVDEEIYIDYDEADGADSFFIRQGSGFALVAKFDGAGYMYLYNIRSGATQVGAGASADELWKTASHASLPDDVVMMGV